MKFSIYKKKLITHKKKCKWDNIHKICNENIDRNWNSIESIRISLFNNINRQDRLIDNLKKQLHEELHYLAEKENKQETIYKENSNNTHEYLRYIDENKVAFFPKYKENPKIKITICEICKRKGAE